MLTQLSLWVWPLEALGPARHHAPSLAHVLALSALAQKSRGWRRLARKPVPLPPASHPRQLHPVGCRTDDAPLPSTEHLCVGYRRSQAGIPQKQSLRQGFKETNPGDERGAKTETGREPIRVHERGGYCQGQPGSSPSRDVWERLGHTSDCASAGRELGHLFSNSFPSLAVGCLGS